MRFDQLIIYVIILARGTCLDHIYTNRSKNIVDVLVLKYALSDHLPGQEIFQAIDMHAPIMHKRVRKVKQPRRLTRDILDQLSKRDTQLKLARAYNTADAWVRFRGARNPATNMITSKRKLLRRRRFRIAKGTLNVFGS